MQHPLPQPDFVLVTPQMGENIGMAARGMLNCGFDQLKLVAPRDGWPNQQAQAASAGAHTVIENTKVFPTVAEAVAGATLVIATSARRRELEKPHFELNDALHHIHAHQGKVAILFGCENSGLTNAELSLADALVSYPINPSFPSLNLAQAVFAMAFSLRRAFLGTTPQMAPPQAAYQPAAPAPKDLIHQMFQFLEACLDEKGFFYPPHKKEKMVQNLQAFLLRANPSTQEVNTFFGVIRALYEEKKGP